MAIKPRRSLKEKIPISESLKRYLLTGSYCGVEGCPDRGYTFLLGRPGREAELNRLWESHRHEILSEWIKKSPCTRPWIWWKFDASEQRLHLSGSGGWHRGMAVDADGLPKYWQITWNKDDPPFFESSAVYLQRHNLLTSTEKKWLAGHPEAMEQESVEFDDSEF